MASLLLLHSSCVFCQIRISQISEMMLPTKQAMSYAEKKNPFLNCAAGRSLAAYQVYADCTGLNALVIAQIPVLALGVV